MDVRSELASAIPHRTAESDNLTGSPSDRHSTQAPLTEPRLAALTELALVSPSGLWLAQPHEPRKPDRTGRYPLAYLRSVELLKPQGWTLPLALARSGQAC